jgi:hypothetical protein
MGESAKEFGRSSVEGNREEEDVQSFQKKFLPFSSMAVIIQMTQGQLAGSSQNASTRPVRTQLCGAFFWNKTILYLED